MSTLADIEAAAQTLPPEQQAELLRFLSIQLCASDSAAGKARLVRQGDDVLLEAPVGAPPMTPENVKRMLQDWP